MITKTEEARAEFKQTLKDDKDFQNQWGNPDDEFDFEEDDFEEWFFSVFLRRE